MAEGHSVARWARWLTSLIGQPLLALDTPRKWRDLSQQLLFHSDQSARPLHLCRISTHGKHLLLHLSDGTVIHCHALMYGSWQVGKPGMLLRKPESRVRLRLRTEKRQAIFFNGPVVEFLTPEEFRGHKILCALGPDILHTDFDRDEVWRRLHLKKHVRRKLGDAVLDQTILAGIGNIFKSEGLFLAKLDPRCLVSEISRKDWERFVDVTRSIMQSSVVAQRGPILTLPAHLRRLKKGPDGRNFVYFRTHKACYVCGTNIARILQGGMQRASYFCPKCQCRGCVLR